MFAAADKAYMAGTVLVPKAAALSAYLDGFEMIEQQLAAWVDAALMRRAEGQFMAVREAIDRERDASGAAKKCPLPSKDWRKRLRPCPAMG